MMHGLSDWLGSGIETDAECQRSVPSTGTRDMVLLCVGQWPSFVRQNDGHFRHRVQWRGSGLAMPVFSMRTQASIGCGEFQDIKAMVDFVAATGMRVLQVRPRCSSHQTTRLSQCSTADATL